jgi:hypothetical protein
VVFINIFLFKRCTLINDRDFLTLSRAGMVNICNTVPRKLCTNSHTETNSYWSILEGKDTICSSLVLMYTCNSGSDVYKGVRFLCLHVIQDLIYTSISGSDVLM